MDLKDLNKSQLILLALLLSFVTSIATGITTVTLMEKAPQSVAVPINRVVRETIEKIVPAEVVDTNALTADQQKLLEDLKAIKPLTVSVFLKGTKEDKLLGTGLFLGENKVVIGSVLSTPKEGEVYVVKSILGEKTVSKVSVQEDITIVELNKIEIIVPTPTPEVPVPETPTSTEATESEIKKTP